MGIQLGRLGASDFQAWNYTKSGMFSVKSAYHLAVQRKKFKQGLVGGSGSCENHRGRLAIWAAHVPGKVRVHVWRLVENGLAVGTELSRRKIKDGIVCLACGRTEDLVHRFWSCPHSASTWFALSDLTGFKTPMPPTNLRCHSELKGWLLDWIGKAKDDELSWFCMMIYKLWLSRNDARDSKEMEDPRAVAIRTKVAVEEWQAINGVSKTPSCKTEERWLCPDESWVKVNVDGAFRAAEGFGGGGVIIRDHHGGFVSGANHFFPHVSDAEGAELLACRRGLVLAQASQVRKLVLETDSTGVAAKLRRDDQDRSSYGALIEEIKFLLSGFEDASVRAVRRSANEAAHLLAKLGCENKVCNEWFEVSPMCVENQIVCDLMPV
jgi:ribonuclease HI